MSFRYLFSFVVATNGTLAKIGRLVAKQVLGEYFMFLRLLTYEINFRAS